MNERVGYRFHPTDEELIDYFLRKKINGTLVCDDIQLIDICKFEPWDLPKYAAQGSNDDEWYFFHRRVPINRNPSKLRYNRSTTTGHWKPTGKVRSVKAKRNRSEIGEKRTLVFYRRTESKKEERTNWVIHEYEPKRFPPYQADLVLCKLKEKADDKAESSNCGEARSSCRGPPSLGVLPVQLPLAETMISNNGINFEQPNTRMLPFEIDEEGISIDDLELPDDVFQSGYNGLRYQFERTEPQSDPDEMDVSLFGENYLRELPAAYNIVNAAAQSHSGICLEDITDMMDDGNFYGMSSHFGDSNLHNGHSGPREYRQMQSVQSLTETLPAPKLELQTCFENLPSIYEKGAATKNLQRHGKIMVAHARSNKHKVEAKMAAGKSEFQLKLSGPSVLKARDDLYLPFKSPKEKITLETESRLKMVTAKTALMSTSRKDKNCSYINSETSMLHQKTVPVSVYIINVSIGLVLFVAAVRDLLILH